MGVNHGDFERKASVTYAEQKRGQGRRENDSRRKVNEGKLGSRTAVPNLYRMLLEQSTSPLLEMKRFAPWWMDAWIPTYTTLSSNVVPLVT